MPSLRSTSRQNARRTKPARQSREPRDEATAVSEEVAEPPEAPSRPCKHYALWLLGRREWSAKELAARLKLKGYPPEDIEECLAFCATHGLQSDSRFAQSRTRMRAGSHGNRRISMELAQKGVDAETTADALSEAGDEKERAMRASARFEGKPFSPELRTKAWRFLMSRGFSGDAVNHALKALQKGQRLDDESFDDD